MFAVAAGVMLLVNIFVMLADERRSELGMLRAIGMRRAPLVGAFALEGWLYALIAAAVGSLVGIGVGWVIAWRADAILSTGEEVNALNMEFSYTNATVLSGFALGFAIALITVVAVQRPHRPVQHHPRHPRHPGTPSRSAPETLRTGRTDPRRVRSRLLASSGSRPRRLRRHDRTVTRHGRSGPQLARSWSPRAVTTVAGVAVLVWAVVAVPVMAALDVSIDIPVFLAQGLVMTTAAIAVVTVHQAAIGRGLARLTGGALPVRLGLAYPLARSFRTAMTLGMFAIVMLTLVYMSVLSFMSRGQGDTFTANLSGGFGIIATSSPSDPLTESQLADLPGVDRVAPLSYLFADFTVDGDDPTGWPVTGFGPELAAAPPTLVDLGSYATNEAAWQAVANDPTLIIVDNNFLASGGGPPSNPADIGETVVITDPRSGQQRQLTVAAIAEDDFINNGAFMSSAGLVELFGERATPSRFFISATEPEQAVENIRSTFVANGADAVTVSSQVDSILAQSSSFFTLMQQFVGAGLVIGVAGIGVIMVRAVRERRRQVGVLRSLGFPTRGVGEVMLFEAGFIALEGIVIGVLIALVASYGFTTAGADWAEGMTWGVPIAEVAIIVTIAIVSTLVAALWPARRAAGIQPAAALRIAD